MKLRSFASLDSHLGEFAAHLAISHGANTVASICAEVISVTDTIVDPVHARGRPVVAGGIPHGRILVARALAIFLSASLPENCSIQVGVGV